MFRDIQDDQGDDGTDTDGDGLTDCVEQQGMPDAAGYLTFTSDPRLADTDGDGLTDGEEVGDGARLADVLEDALEPLGMEPPEDVGDGIVYRVFSDPRVDDSDADGLSDPEEADFGSRARSTETDGDGLSDEREMQIGTDPTDVNTDGDGRDDGYEDTHRDADFDPLEPDEEMSAGDYVTQFMKGAVCRNPWMSLCDDDSIAWLAGNIAAGFFAVPDILDAVGQIYHLDVVGAGTSLISIVPLGGDALSVVVKTRTFIGHNPTQSGPALRRLMHDPNFPAAHKIDLLNHVYGPELVRLRNNGLTDTHANKLVAGRVDQTPRRHHPSRQAHHQRQRLPRLGHGREQAARGHRRQEGELRTEAEANRRTWLSLRRRVGPDHTDCSRGEDRLRTTHPVCAAPDRQGPQATRRRARTGHRMALLPQLDHKPAWSFAPAARRAAT